MKVKLWGTRGDIAIPRPETRTYGVNTLCVQVDVGEEPIILDGGMGLHWLGHELVRKAFGRGAGRAHLLLSHTHWSHIQGLPFFVPMLIPGNSFHIYGHGGDTSLRELLLAQMHPTYCPVPNFFCDAIGAAIEVHELDAGTLELGAAQVDIARLGAAHGAPCLAYRISDGRRSLAYLPAVEYADKSIRTRARALAQGADLLIHDAYYHGEECAAHRGRGHCCARHALDVAQGAQVGRLLLFNHHPDRTDAALDALAHLYARTSPPVEVARQEQILAI